MPLHHNLGTSGLRLRTEQGERALALANTGPLLDGAYESAAALEAAEAGRVVAELALDTPGRICLAVDDGAALLPRLAGDPNPQYTLYRLVPTRQTGPEPVIEWGGAERLEAVLEPCDIAAFWQLTAPSRLATADQALDSTAGWSLAESRTLSACDEPLDVATRWTLTPTVTVPPSTPLAIQTGADILYAEDLAADWAAANAGGWISALRWWANSNGPYSRHAANAIAAWHPVVPSVRWDAFGHPPYARAEAAGKGALAFTGTEELLANAIPGFAPSAAWSLLLVARAAAPRQAAQGTLFGAGYIGMASGADGDSIELQCGTATEGMRVVWGDRASCTFAAPLSTAAFQIVELVVPAGTTLSGWQLWLDGAAQTVSASTNGALAWAGNAPDQFSAGMGWWNSPSATPWAPFHGDLAEIILLQSADPTLRAAVRSYLAAKFAITLTP